MEAYDRGGRVARPPNAFSTHTKDQQLRSSANVLYNPICTTNSSEPVRVSRRYVVCSLLHIFAVSTLSPPSDQGGTSREHHPCSRYCASCCGDCQTYERGQDISTRSEQMRLSSKTHTQRYSIENQQTVHSSSHPRCPNGTAIRNDLIKL